MIALSLVCLMTSTFCDGVPIVASPATTLPPCGSASAALDTAMQIAKLSGWKAKRRRTMVRPATVRRRVFMERSLELAA